jgi:hypothetical protein
MNEIIKIICKECTMGESRAFNDRCREVIDHMLETYDAYEMLRILNDEVDREITAAAEQIPEKTAVDNLEIHLSAAIFQCYYVLIVKTFKLADTIETYDMLNKATLDRVKGFDDKVRPGQQLSIFMKIKQDENWARGIKIK